MWGRFTRLRGLRGDADEVVVGKGCGCFGDVKSIICDCERGLWWYLTWERGLYLFLLARVKSQILWSWKYVRGVVRKVGFWAFIWGAFYNLGAIFFFWSWGPFFPLRFFRISRGTFWRSRFRRWLLSFNQRQLFSIKIKATFYFCRAFLSLWITELFTFYQSTPSLSPKINKTYSKNKKSKLRKIVITTPH